jgi:hypothetical protein
MSTCVVLHWWNDDVNVKPYEDRYNPIILTIMQLRAYNDLPIYVIDVSEYVRPMSDWAHFPYKFKFRVIKRDSYLKELMPLVNPLYNLRLLSRVWDIELAMRNVPEDNIMFMDSDIFCLKPLSPLMANTFPEYFFSNYNNGVWFYNKRSKSSKFVFDTWKSMICRFLHDDDFRHELHGFNPNYGTFYVQDEFVYRGLAQLIPYHIKPINMMQNYLFQWLYKDPSDITAKIIGLHCLSFLTGKDRHLLFFTLAELWNTVTTHLDNKEYRMIFGNRQPTETFSMTKLYQNRSRLKQLYRLLAIEGQREAEVFDKIIEEFNTNAGFHIPLL